jgi:hypothetical protein
MPDNFSFSEEGGAAPRPDAQLDSDDDSGGDASTPSADERGDAIRDAGDDSSQSSQSSQSSGGSSGGTSVSDLPGVSEPSDSSGSVSTPSADERGDTVRDAGNESNDSTQSSGTTSQSTQSSGGDTGTPQASDRDTAGINFDAVDQFERVQDAKGGSIQGHEAGVPISSDPDSAVGEAVDQLESETVTDLGRGDVQTERVQRDGQTVISASLTDGALADERDERREVASGINQASDRDFAGIDRSAVDAFSGGDGVTAADEVFAERRAEDNAEQQLEQQTGRDLDRGEDFTVSETDSGVRAELTDEGQRKIAPSREEFGDIPVQNPLSDNRVETDLRREDDRFNNKIAEPLGGGAGEIFDTLNPTASEKGTELVAGGVEGAASVASPAGLALDAKEAGEFAVTQPSRVFTGSSESVAETDGLVTQLGSGDDARADFRTDTQDRGERVATAATTAVKEGDAQAIGTAVGGIAAASIGGAKIAGRVPGTPDADIVKTAPKRAARGSKSVFRKGKIASRRLAGDTRAQGEVPRSVYRNNEFETSERVPDEVGEETITVQKQRQRADSDDMASVEQQARDQLPPEEEFPTRQEFDRELSARMNRIERQERGLDRDASRDSSQDTSQRTTQDSLDGDAFVTAGATQFRSEQNSGIQGVVLGEEGLDTAEDALVSEQSQGAAPALFGAETEQSIFAGSAVQTGAAQEGILGTDAGTSTVIDSSTALGTDTETDTRAGAGVTPAVFTPGGGATQFDLPDNGNNAEEELQPLSSQTSSSTFDTEIASGEEVLFGSNSDDEGEGNGLYRDGFESLLR